MSKFKVVKRVSLSFLGDGWQDAYVTVQPYSYADELEIISMRKVVRDADNRDLEEIKEAALQMVDKLKTHFIEGQGWNGEKLVPITKDDLLDLPTEAINLIMIETQGVASLPNSQPPSNGR